MFGGAHAAGWPTLLLIDADARSSSAIVCYFEKRGFHVASATTFAEARDYVHRRKSWTLIIADCHLPDATGLEVREWLDEEKCAAPVLLTSDSPHCATLCAGRDYLPKPLSLEKLEAYVRQVRGPA